jgi:predicted nucleotidyltransferase
MTDPRLHAVIGAQPYPLLFVTVSGAHLYGFPSPDSDYDLRGVHLLPARGLLGLETPRETVESSGVHDGLEIDLVTHDAGKFFRLMLKKNGYVLEQLLSPIVLHSTPEHAELKEIGRRCVTKFHAYHYLGFAETQWRLFDKEQPRRVKPLLYVYRVLLTGIHLMRTGLVEANLLTLNEEYRLPYVDDLVARKLSGPELGTLPDTDADFHRAEYERLVGRLRAEHEASALPPDPSAKGELSDLLVRLRIATI